MCVIACDLQLRRAFEHHSGAFSEECPLGLGLKCWVLVGALLFARVGEIFGLRKTDFIRHLLETAEVIYVFSGTVMSSCSNCRVQDTWGDGNLRSWYDWNQLRACKNFKGGVANMKKVACMI